MSHKKSALEIRLLIEEELNSHNSLRDSNAALTELGGLIDTERYTIDKSAVGHIMSLLHDNIKTRIDNIELLVKQLGAS